MKTGEQIYNDLKYDVGIELNCKGGTYPINPTSILSMNISESLTEWVTMGSLTFMFAQNNPDDKPFEFRMDGYDTVTIYIKPKQTSEKGISVSDSDPNWILYGTFSIYDIEDLSNKIPGAQGAMASVTRGLKLKFKDIRHHIFSTANIEYCTRYSPHAQGEKLNTGIAIWEVFKKAFENTGYSVYAKDYQSDPENWDEGKSIVFYTSPAEYSAHEDQIYLLSQHVTNTELANGVYDIPVMYTDRLENANPNKDGDTPDLPPIRIRALSKLFEKAKSGQIEQFLTTSFSNEKKTPGNTNFKSPIEVGISAAKEGQLMSISFSDMPAVENSLSFITRPVYHYNLPGRTFVTTFTNNKVTDAKKLIADKYISNVYIGGDPEQLFLPVQHQSKKDTSLFPSFSLNDKDPILRQRNGVHSLLFSGIFQNGCVYFKTNGLTQRRPGTFIGIDRTDGSESIDYNNKVYGQYLIVKVDHVFDAGTYKNIIYGVKVHRFEEPAVTFKDTLQS